MQVALATLPTSQEWFDQQRLFRPLAPYLLASSLRDHGHEVRVCDVLNFLSGDLDAALQEMLSCDVVALSCNSFNYPESLLAARRLKETNPDIQIVLGGMHVSYLPAEAMAYPEVDFVVRGEGEFALPQLLDAIAGKRQLSEVPGLSYRRAGEVIHNPAGAAVDLATVPMPAYDLMPPDLIYLPFEVSRGCQNRCTFCSVLKENAWRPFPEETVLERLDRSLSLYRTPRSIKSIQTTDDCFTTDPARAVRLLRQINERFPKISIRIEARVRDLFHDDLLHAISECNVSLVQIGVECGYDDGLRRIRKGTTVDQVRQCAARLAKFGLGRSSFFSFIFGFPWESPAECLTTIGFAEEMWREHRVPSNVVPWLALPSRLAGESGFMKDSWYSQEGWWRQQSHFFATHPQFEAKDLMEIGKRIQDLHQESHKYWIFHSTDWD